MKYIIDKSDFPYTCFPADLDTSSLVYVTPVGSPWAEAMDIETWRLHRCEDYYAECTGMNYEELAENEKRVINIKAEARNVFTVEQLKDLIDIVMV